MEWASQAQIQLLKGKMDQQNQLMVASPPEAAGAVLGSNGEDK